MADRVPEIIQWARMKWPVVLVIWNSASRMDAMTTILGPFMAKVEEIAGCWIWRGSILRNGYGQFYSGGPHLAHRYSYELHKGPIPKGLVIDHLCRVRRCVNPDHLEAVTQSINLLRGETLNASEVTRMVCPSGHPYNETNTRIYRGRRFCKACEAPKTRRYRARQATLRSTA